MQLILGRKRRIAGNFVFSTSIYPLFTLTLKQQIDYEVVKMADKGVVGDVTAVLQKVQELTVLSPQDPGTLVILSGGETGWLDNSDFSQRMHSLLNLGWKFDIYAWQNNTKAGQRWYNSDQGHSIAVQWMEVYSHYFNLP